MDVLKWSQILDAIIAIGFPATMAIVKMWQEKKEVTVENLAEAQRLGTFTPTSLTKEALAGLGVDLNDPRAIAFLELVKSKAPAPGG